MSSFLEDLDYQRRAIDTVADIFDGQVRNSFDNANFFGIQANVTDLAPEKIEENKRGIVARNGLDVAESRLGPENDICIEMETGTGKTLVYFRTLYELYQKYRLTKFIILVPSIAIKEGALSTFEAFKEPLAERYGFTPACFEYDSGKLSRLRHFIEDTQPQIMVMTIQSIISDDRIINQQGRDDSFNGLTYLQALGKCQPVVVMDEPQEGMDTAAAVEKLGQLNPLVKLRYSATHKILRNLLYRLTPFDAYQQGMVKKIEVLSVAEKHDEATLKLELMAVEAKGGANPRARLNLWRKSGDGFKLKESNWLKPGDNIADKSGNISYADYAIDRIWKDLHDKLWRLKFTNGVELVEKERAADFSGIFRQQLHWLIRRHFEKKARLEPLGIKCLSLVFIDRVDNYVRDDGLIKILFQEEYARLCLDQADGGNRQYILVQLPELTAETSIAHKQGFKRISDITIERTRRVIQKRRKEVEDLLPGDERRALAESLGFKVYALAKSAFPRVDFTPDPERDEAGNAALLQRYMAEKEQGFQIQLEKERVRDEVLLKQGFLLDYALTPEPAFTKNDVVLVRDRHREAFLCLDLAIAPETVDYFDAHRDRFFICLERALDTAKKWNLKLHLADKLKTV